MGPPLVLLGATPSAAAGFTCNVYGAVCMDVHARMGQQGVTHVDASGTRPYGAQTADAERHVETIPNG